MPARDVVKNLNLFVEGRGYAGQIDEYNPPKLTVMVEDYRGGGMDTATPIDMGMEPLESTFALISYDADVLRVFGVAAGRSVSFACRAALESEDGTVTAVEHVMRGKLVEIDPGTWKPGDKPSLTCKMRLNYYKHTQGGEVIHEVDVANMVRIIGGVDRLAEIRGALGL